MPERESAPDAPHLVVRGLRKSFGSVVAVDDFSLDVPRGSFTTLLGPSGCGKSTVLRILAGFVAPDSGTVCIGGQDQQDLPPNVRGVGMVFQDYALFPHLSVQANVEYGLRMRRLAPGERRVRARRALELLDLAATAGRYPHELSGGQQQRVALGRVLVLEPEVLLMDEPLSNLDAKLRLRLRNDLKDLQRRLGITTIYVTHDQEEALSLADQVVVMNAGAVQQVGAPRNVYRGPANRFVAGFVGLANLLPVEVLAVEGDHLRCRALGRELRVGLPDVRLPSAGATGVAMVRPEHVALAARQQPGGEPASLGTASSRPGGATASQRAAAHFWSAPAVVESSDYFGPYDRVRVRLEGVTEPWLVDVPAGGAAAATAAGDLVSVSLAPDSASWLW